MFFWRVLVRSRINSLLVQKEQKGPLILKKTKKFSKTKQAIRH